MRCTPGARLALVSLLVCAPAAWAEGPLGPGMPCKTIDQVRAAISFEAGFLPLETKACEKLCKKARATCAKQVNRAITCAQRSVDDSTFFQEKVSCDGQHGGALKTCRQPFEDSKKQARSDLEADRDDALEFCSTQAETCAGSCNAP